MNEWLPKFKSENLRAKIAEISQGLTYISETDAAIEPLDDIAAINYLFEKDTHEKDVKEISFDEFFRRLTEQRDWYGRKEKEKAESFAELKKLLEENLRGPRVFKVGRIQIDIYVVGLDADNNFVGIKTKAVET